MPTTGSPAPAFVLPDLAGRLVDSRTLWQDRPVLLLFYKVTCPTCHLAMPRLEAMHRAYGERLTVIGIAQDPADAAADFARAHGATFRQLRDEAPYPVSTAYGLQHVPTLLLIEPGGQIARRLVGWDKADMNGLSAAIATGLSLPALVVSPPEDGLPVFKPG